MTEIREEDTRWMLEAVAAGAQYQGYTSPNPPVGCVIVRDGECIGRGGHTKAGAPHGEVEAIRDAGDCRGATAYVTLEPCNHTGRTGPCVEALKEAGVVRVVIGVSDPNPHVQGSGASALRDAGIEVVEGVAVGPCQDLMAPFLRFCRVGLPFVTLKVASTLDGRIGQTEGGQVWLTGPEAQQEVHRIRDRVDVIMVGSGTVLSDDPRLTTRLPDREGRQPIRVVLDRRLQTPIDAHLVVTAHSFPSRIYTTLDAPAEKVEALRKLHVDVRLYSGSDEDEQAFLRWVLVDLAEDGRLRILLEGGATLNAAMLGGGWVSQVVWMFTASIGGAPFVPAVNGIIASTLGERIRLKDIEVLRLGADFCIRGKVLSEEE